VNAPRRAIRPLAIYLPQFHPIPENDEWWGKGFTEWTNVAGGRPQFPGHYQPHLPGELGFYDLRLGEVREAQAALARAHGIHGFCYYHYWFNGKLLLERPLQEILSSGKPDFPFCMCWANENWTRRWDGGEAEVLIGQHYGEADDRAHFDWLLPYFRDPRYIRVRGRPVFAVYRASYFPDVDRTLAIWREQARAAGFPDLYLIRVEATTNDRGPLGGFDAAMEFQPDWHHLGRPIPSFLPERIRRAGLAPSPFHNYIYRYADVVDRMLSVEPPPYKRFPCVTPSWDNSARRHRRSAKGRRSALILHQSSPAEYERWLRNTVERFTPFGEDEDFVFINAWNEWAEGNHLEPCARWGRGYLEATRRALGA
jgi:lipopolysaccharide biosynthesis protein